MIALRPDRGRQRQPAAEALAEYHDVGLDAEMLVGVEQPRAAEPDFHLVADHQDAVPAAERLHRPEVVARAARPCRRRTGSAQGTALRRLRAAPARRTAPPARRKLVSRLPRRRRRERLWDSAPASGREPSARLAGRDGRKSPSSRWCPRDRRRGRPGCAAALSPPPRRAPRFRWRPSRNGRARRDLAPAPARRRAAARQARRRAGWPLKGGWRPPGWTAPGRRRRAPRDGNDQG